MSYPSLFNTDTESLLSEFSSSTAPTSTNNSSGNGVAAGATVTTSANGPPTMMAQQGGGGAYSSQYAGGAPGYPMYNYPGQQQPGPQQQGGYYGMQPGKMMPQGAYMTQQPPQQQQQSMNQQPQQQAMYNTAPSGPYGGVGQPMAKMNNQMVVGGGGAPPNMVNNNNPYPPNNNVPMNQQMWSNSQMGGYNTAAAMSSPQFKQQQQGQPPHQMMPMAPMQQQQQQQPTQQPMYNKMNQFNNASKPMAHQQHQQQQQQASYGNFKPSGMPNGAPMPPGGQPGGYMSGGKPMAMQQHQQMQPPPPQQQQGQIHSVAGGGVGGPPVYGYNPNMTKQLSSLPPHMQGAPMMQQQQQQQQPQQAQFNPQSPSSSNKMNLVGSPYQQQQQQQQIKPMAPVTVAGGNVVSTTGVPNATTTPTAINVNVPAGGGGYSTNTTASTLSPNRSMSQPPPPTGGYYNTSQTTTYNTTPSGYSTYTGSVMPTQGQQTYVTTTGPYGSYGSGAGGTPNGVYSTTNTGYGMPQQPTMVTTTDPMGLHSTPSVQQPVAASVTTPESASTTPTKRGRGRGKKQSANSETSSPTAGDGEEQGAGAAAKPKGKRGKKSNTTPEPASLSLSPGPLASSNNNTTGSSSSMLYPPTSIPARPPSNSYASNSTQHMSGPATSPSPNRATPAGVVPPPPQPTTGYPTAPQPGTGYHYGPPPGVPYGPPATYNTSNANAAYPIAQNSQNVMMVNPSNPNQMNGMVYNTSSMPPNASTSSSSNNTSMPPLAYANTNMMQQQQPGNMMMTMKPQPSPLQTANSIQVTASQVSPPVGAAVGAVSSTTVKKPEETSPVGGVSPAAATSAGPTMYNPQSSNNSSQPMPGMPPAGSFVTTNPSVASSYQQVSTTQSNYVNSAPLTTHPNTMSSTSAGGGNGAATITTPSNNNVAQGATASFTSSSSSSSSNMSSQQVTSQPNLIMSTQPSQDNSIKLPPQNMMMQSPYMSTSNGSAGSMMHPSMPSSSTMYSAYPSNEGNAKPQMMPVMPVSAQTSQNVVGGGYMMPPPGVATIVPMSGGQTMSLQQPQQSPYMQPQHQQQVNSLQQQPTGESFNMTATYPPTQPPTSTTQQPETTPGKKLTKKQLREMQQQQQNAGVEVDPNESAASAKKQRKIKPKQQKSADNSLVAGEGSGSGEASNNGPNNNAHIESTIDDLMKQYNISSKKKTGGKKKKKIKDLDDDEEEDGAAGSDESEMDDQDDDQDADYNDGDGEEDKAGENQLDGGEKTKKRGPKRGKKKAKAPANDSFDEELAAMMEKSANEEEPRKKRKYTKKKSAKEGGDEAASELDNSTAVADSTLLGESGAEPVVQTPDLGDRFKRIVLSNSTSNSNRGRRKSTQNLIKLMAKKQRKKRKKTSSGEEDADEDDDSDDYELNTMSEKSKSSAAAARKENTENGGDASNTETGPAGGENGGGDDAAMARELQDNNKRRSVRSAASKKTKFVTIKDEDLLMPVDPNEEEAAEQGDTNIVVASQDNFIVDKILGIRLAKRKTMRKKEKPPKQPKSAKVQKEATEQAKEEPTTTPAAVVITETKEPVEPEETKKEEEMKPAVSANEEDIKMEVDSSVKSPVEASEAAAIQPEDEKSIQTPEKPKEIELNGKEPTIENDVNMETKENDDQEEKSGVVVETEQEPKEDEKTVEKSQDDEPTPKPTTPQEDVTPQEKTSESVADTIESDNKKEEPTIAESKIEEEKKEPVIVESATKVEEEEEEEEDDVSEYEEDGGEIEVEEFFVKYKNLSYMHCEWRTRDEIFATDKRIDQKIKRFKLKRQQAAQAYDWDDEFPVDPRGYNNDYDELFNPDYQVVDRILDESEMDDLANPGGAKLKYYLVKWKSLPYDEASWELEQDLKDKSKIERFREVNKYQPDVHAKHVPKPKAERWTQLNSTRTYKKGNKLREYQLEGINWLTFCWLNGRNCILADEMGLGKTVQSITYLQEIYNYGVRGPFLVIVPLSTMGNWMKEFENWTDFNVIVYHGSSISRQMIQDYEFYFKDANNSIVTVNQLGKKQPVVKFNALVTTYEVLLSDVTLFCQFKWRTTVIDEAHRLKNKNCKLIEGLRYLDVEHKVLLTGTPLQNNVEELFSLLNFLEPSQFKSSQEFLDDFGDLKTDTQVTKLQTILKPMMLRRLKEDVEKNLAPKEETIVEVELTNIQKKYYRAILEKNFQFLARGAVGANVPNLMNTMMELRKCCNHPYLINGAEDAIVSEYIEQQNRTVAEKSKPEKQALKAMVQSSGKLVLVDKLLPKLKAGGHKVLIFSQMIRVLDILEDYLIQNRFTYERIDGRIRGDLRQEAIERYSKPDSDRFVFLLCTRAGGLGINLTAADTVIIYDSDWNPQNDLQAQARCHRIGQQKSVKIYRLITRNTYEREMFDKASLKLGLDKAVLQSMRSDDRLNQNMQLSKAEIEELLKKGAYGAIMEDDNAGEEFCEEDIDKILQQRSTVIQIEGGEKGSTFSKASFQASDTNTEISLDDPEFWQKWARKAEIDVEEKLNPRDERIIYEPRKRMQTRRYGGPDDLLEESDYSSASGSDNENNGGPNDKKTRGRKKRGRDDDEDNEESSVGAWTRDDCYKVEKNLLIYGWSRWATILRHCEPLKKKSNLLSEQEAESLARAICAFALKNYHGEESIRQFIIDMIDPAKSNFDALKTHQGLAAPVPRGRKRGGADVSASASATTTTSSIAGGDDKKDLAELEWAKNVDDLLNDGYKRHLIRQASKLLLRLRTLFYIKHEIIGDEYSAKLDQFHLSNSEVDETISHDQIDLQLPDVLTELPAEWWDKQCDQSLLIGVYKHGFERYYQIRMDPKLCFLSICGQPDANEVQEEAASGEKIDEPVEEEEEEKSSKKKGRKKKKDEEECDDEEETNVATSKPVVTRDETDGDEKSVKQFPSHHELNNRMRRLIAAVQKHKKQLQLAEKRNADKQEKRSAKLTAQQERANLRQAEKQTKWSRREEQNFYKTISTYGVDCVDVSSQTYAWERFKEIGQLDKKLDETLTDYLHSFMVMCKRVCNKYDEAELALPADVQPVQVEQISEERATRCLQRIELLNKVRSLPKHDKFAEWLADERLLPSSPDLPDWYMPGKHDRDLVVGAARYGLTPRTDYYFLNDQELAFRPYLEKYMRHIERLMDEDNKAALQSAADPSAQHLQTDPVQYYFQNQARIQATYRHQVVDKEIRKLVRKQKQADKLKEKEAKSMIKEEEEPAKEEPIKEVTEEGVEDENDVSQKMIIDETLIEENDEKKKSSDEIEEKKVDNQTVEEAKETNGDTEDMVVTETDAAAAAEESKEKEEKDIVEKPESEKESNDKEEAVKESDTAVEESKESSDEKDQESVPVETKSEEDQVKEPESTKEELKTEVVEAEKSEETKEANKVKEKEEQQSDNDDEEEEEASDEPPPTNYFAAIVGSGVGTPMILWPKERVLAHRLDSIIHLFEHNGEWPLQPSLAQQQQLQQQMQMMHGSMNSPMMSNNPLSIANLVGGSNNNNDWNGMDNEDDMDDMDQDMTHMDLKLMSGSVDSPSSATSSAKYPKPKRGRPPKSELTAPASGDENKFLEPGEIMNQRMRASGNNKNNSSGRFNDAASEHSDTSSTSSHSNLKPIVNKRGGGRKSMTPLNQNQPSAAGSSSAAALDNINQNDLATLAALFLQPGMDPDERVTVVNIHDQTKLTGHRAPRRSELAMWLLTHPNYIPDEAEIMNLTMKATMAQQQHHQQQQSQTPPAVDQSKMEPPNQSSSSNNPIVLFNKVTNKRVNPMKVPPLKSLSTFLERNEQIYIDQSSNDYLRSKYPRGQLPDIIKSRMIGGSSGSTTTPAKTTRTESPVNTKPQQQQQQNQSRKSTSNKPQTSSASTSSAVASNQPAIPAGMEQLAALFGGGGAGSNPLEAMMGQMPGLNELLANPAALSSMMMDPTNPLASFLAMSALTSGGGQGSNMLPPFPFGDTSAASNAFNPFLMPPVPGLTGGAGGAGNMPPGLLTDMLKEMMNGGGGRPSTSSSNSELEMAAAFNELANQFANNEHLNNNNNNKDKSGHVRDSPAPPTTSSRRKPSASANSNPAAAATPPPAPSPKPSNNNKASASMNNKSTPTGGSKKSDNLNMLSKKITDHNQKKGNSSSSNSTTKSSGNGNSSSSNNNSSNNNNSSADLTALMQQLSSGQINDPAMLAALLNPELIQELMSMQGGGGASANPFMPPTSNNNNNHHTSHSSSSSPAPFSPAVSNTKSKQSSSSHHAKPSSRPSPPPQQRPPSTLERSSLASPALSANSVNSSSILQPPVPSMADLNMFMNMMMGGGGMGSNPLSALMPPPPPSGVGGFGADMPMELLAAALSNPSALAGLDPSMFSALAQLNSLSNAAAASSSDMPDMSRQSKKTNNNNNNSSKQSSSSSQPQSKRLKLSADNEQSGGGDSSGFPGLDLSMKKPSSSSSSSDHHHTPSSRSSSSKTKK